MQCNKNIFIMTHFGKTLKGIFYIFLSLRAGIIKQKSAPFSCARPSALCRRWDSVPTAQREQTESDSAGDDLVWGLVESGL